MKQVLFINRESTKGFKDGFITDSVKPNITQDFIVLEIYK